MNETAPPSAQGLLPGPPRVLYPYTSFNFGGSLVSALVAARAGRLNGGWESVFMLPGSGPAADKVRSFGFEPVFYPIDPQVIEMRTSAQNRGMRLASRVRSLAILPHALRGIGETGPDIVHVNDLSDALLWGLAANIRKVPAVLHVRTERIVPYADFLRARPFAAVIFLSEGARRKFSAMRPRRPEVVPNGAADFGFSETKDRRKGCLRVLFVGNLVPRKRPMLAVEAVKALRDAGMDIELDMVGRPHFSEIADGITAMAASGDGSWLRYHGFQPDVSAFYRESDVLLLTSTSDGEALPRCALEAHAHGLPVVATECGSVREIVAENHTGLIVGPQETDRWCVKEIAERIGQLAADEAMFKRFRRNAFRHASTRFNPDALSRRIAEIYRSVLNNANH